MKKTFLWLVIIAGVIAISMNILNPVDETGYDNVLMISCIASVIIASVLLEEQ